MTPSLSICIPAYRRPDQLRRCLESVIRSAGTLPVPVIVADDSTDDVNVEVMEDLRRHYPLLVHHRNPVNLGIDRNILNVIDLARTRYAWALGEDDRLRRGAIPAVARVLAASEPSFLYVNYASIDEAASTILAERSIPIDRDLALDATTFLAEHAWSAGFLGACVVNRDLWQGVRQAPYVGTWFAHVGVILESIVGRTMQVVAEPHVLNRCGAARAFSWVGSTFDVLGGWARMVDLLRPHYPASACDAAQAAFLRAHGIGTARFFGYLRADRALTPEAWEAHVRHGPYPAVNRAIAWSFARTPPALFQAVRWMLTGYRRVRYGRVTGP